MDVNQGEIVTIIANGAGKTTTLKTICGLVPYLRESVFQDKDITGMPVSYIVEAGIAMVPEGRRVFPR